MVVINRERTAGRICICAGNKTQMNAFLQKHLQSRHKAIRMRRGNFKATWKSLCEEHGKEDRTLRENRGLQTARIGNAEAQKNIGLCAVHNARGRLYLVWNSPLKYMVLVRKQLQSLCVVDLLCKAIHTLPIVTKWRCVYYLYTQVVTESLALV